VFAALSGAGFFVAVVIMGTRFVMTRPRRRSRSSRPSSDVDHLGIVEPARSKERHASGEHGSHDAHERPARDGVGHNAGEESECSGRYCDLAMAHRVQPGSGRPGLHPRGRFGVLAPPPDCRRPPE
jgi:hypothetical protein